MDFTAHLEGLETNGSLRSLSYLARNEGSYVGDKKPLLNLCSNDYLGIAGNINLQKQFFEKVGSLSAKELLAGYGLGSTSSRLLSGDCEMAAGLEMDLQEAYGRPALLFNSGYHANIGILPCLAGKSDLILSDKLNHASIHDGLNLSRADHKRYPHCDYANLRELLVKYRKNYKNVFIVSESVFSMDGDVADLAELVALKNEYNCILYIDEAHAVGLYGAQGLGVASEQGVLKQIDLLVGTFGKAYASVGAYVISQSDIKEYLINYSRSLIFTTALPAICYHWNRFVFTYVIRVDESRQKLKKISDNIRKEIVGAGFKTAGSTNIIPVIIGHDEKAVQAGQKMAEYGYHVLAVRPPTVPKGTARFRLSLCVDMSEESLANLVPSIKKVI